VLAYRQTITDLYSGARTDLNGLNDVATGELLDKGLMNIQQSLGEGWRYEPAGVQVRMASARPIEILLGADPDRIVLAACIDAGGVAGIAPDGERTSGVREELTYEVVRTTYLREPGWAVSRVTSDEDDPAERSC
jgi:hypothetical protein